MKRNNKKIMAAFNDMKRRIANGQGYPDAHAHACNKHDLGTDEADRVAYLYNIEQNSEPLVNVGHLMNPTKYKTQEQIDNTPKYEVTHTKRGPAPDPTSKRQSGKQIVVRLDSRSAAILDDLKTLNNWTTTKAVQYALSACHDYEYIGDL